MNLLSLKRAFLNAGVEANPVNTQEFYVDLPSKPSFFNDFFKQTGLHPEDVIGERDIPNEAFEVSHFNNLFSFHADPDIVYQHAKQSDVEFLQRYTVFLHTSDIHKFRELADLKHFTVPPSQRREGVNAYYIMGESNKIRQAVEQWEEQNGVDLNLRLESTDPPRNETNYELPLFNKSHAL